MTFYISPNIFGKLPTLSQYEILRCSSDANLIGGIPLNMLQLVTLDVLVYHPETYAPHVKDYRYMKDQVLLANPTKHRTACNS